MSEQVFVYVFYEYFRAVSYCESMVSETWTKLPSILKERSDHWIRRNMKLLYLIRTRYEACKMEFGITMNIIQ